MIEPKSVDITKSFTTSGVKEIGEYTYVLLIDGGSSLTLIKRVKLTNSEIKFVKREEGTIESFWADPTVHTYVWINSL
ncbi:unnamed protein product [marine sediment metagenome]|uniref:Uncharacterized protein n=1 Tax=marine sediment metagenome TaxID=412755 RepID=X1AAL0_9ZZZZ